MLNENVILLMKDAIFTSQPVKSLAKPNTAEFRLVSTEFCKTSNILINDTFLII